MRTRQSPRGSLTSNAVLRFRSSLMTHIICGEMAHDVSTCPVWALRVRIYVIRRKSNILWRTRSREFTLMRHEAGASDFERTAL